MKMRTLAALPFLLTSFATVAGAGLPEWPAIDPVDPVHMELGEHLGPRSVLPEDVIQFFERQWNGGASPTFDPDTDLLSLHYDHAPDKDDGQSAVADRTVLQTLFGADWLSEHVVPVSGAYGENASDFDPGSDTVMDIAWNDVGGWFAAHQDHASAIEALAGRWAQVLEAGGDVWVKEGGQSDLTAGAVARLRAKYPQLNTMQRIHVVQHSDWNEDQTTDAALAYTKEHTDYIRIRDANAYLNSTEYNEAFVAAATAHPLFGAMWKAAFAYYDPRERLDFSDTGELLHILSLGELDLDAFRARFLDADGKEPVD